MRYLAEFKDEQDHVWRIEIYSSNIGNWKNIQLGGNPLKIISTAAKLQDSVIGTGVEMDILVTDDDGISQSEYEQLFLQPPLTYKCDIYQDTVIVFKGYIDVNMYNESYTSRPYNLTLSASDGLKGLKNYQLDIDSTYNSLDTLIHECLKKTKLDLPIFAMNTMLSEDMQYKGFLATISQVKSCFQLSQCDTSAFDKKDVYSILTSILKSFNCIIYQENGEWHIDRVNDKYNKNHTVRDINLYGGLNYRDRDITPKAVGTNLIPFIGRSQGLTVNAPYGTQTIEGDLNSGAYNLNTVDKTIEAHANIATYDYDFAKYYANIGNTDSLHASDSDFTDGYMKHIYNLDASVNTAVTFNLGARFKISTPVFFVGYKSDEIKVSYKIKPNLNISTVETKTVLIPIAISINNKRIKANISSSGSFNYYQVSDDPNACIVRRIQVDSTTNNTVIEDSFTIKIANAKTTDPYADINITDGVYSDIMDFRVVIKAVAEDIESADYKIFTASDKKMIYFTKSLANINDFSIGDIRVEVDEIKQYDNTYTGVLTSDYLGEAPKIDIALWNPVQGNLTPYARGLVSDSSSWVNFNFKSNLFKYYDDYINPSKLDEHAGLGLWYTLDELMDNHFNEHDFGSRLCSHIIKDWMNLYSDNQSKITGILDIDFLPKISQSYSVEGRENSIFVILQRKYNVKRCECNILLHEIKDDKINIDE